MITELRLDIGRAVAQAVSRRLPIAEARVRPRVKLCGIREIFMRVLGKRDSDVSKMSSS
jgi:hypothetical protein